MEPTNASHPRRTVLLLGYWPPTDVGVPARHGMLWDFRAPQRDYHGSGYDVVAVSPTFTAPLGWRDATRTTPHWGIGGGDFSVEYHDASRRFWRLVDEHRPAAIMSFSRGRVGRWWELEQYARNLEQARWVTNLHHVDLRGEPRVEGRPPPLAGGGPDDPSPFRGLGERPGSPPDPTVPTGTMRPNNLPIDAILAALSRAFPPHRVAPICNPTGDVGAFLSEFVAYHVAWYRDHVNHCNPDDPSRRCWMAGHTHVGTEVEVADGAAAVELQLAQLFAALPRP